MLMSLFASRSCNSTPRTTGAPAQGVTPSDLVARRRTDGVTLPQQQNVQANRGGREGVDLWRNLPHLRTRPPQQRASVLREGQECLTTQTQPGVRDDIRRPSSGILEKRDVANLLEAALAGAALQPDETRWRRLGEGLESLLSGMQDHQKEESVNYLMQWLQQVTEEQESSSMQASDVAESADTDFRTTFLQQLELIAGIVSPEMACGSSYCDPVDLVGSFGELSEGPAALNDSGTEFVYAQGPGEVSGSAATGELSEEEGPYPAVPQPQLLSQDRSISLSSFLTDFSSSDAGLPEFALSPLQASPATSSHGSQPQSDNGSPRPPCSDDDLPLPSLLRRSTEWGNLQSSLGYETGAVAGCSSTTTEPGPCAQLPILPPPPSTFVPPGLAASLTASQHPRSAFNPSAMLMPSASSKALSPPLPSSSLGLHEPHKPNTLTTSHTLTLPQNLLSFSNPSASSDSEAGSPLHRGTKARESLHSFSDPDVPMPTLQSTSTNRRAGESTRGLLHKEKTLPEGKDAATALVVADTRSAMVTGTMGNVGGAMGAGTSNYADTPGPSSSRTSEISGMGLLSGGGITWDETEEGSTFSHLVGEVGGVRDGVSGMEFGGSLDVPAGGSDGLENWDGKANGDGGHTAHMGSGEVSEAGGAAAGTVQSGGGAVGTEAVEFELIHANRQNKVVAEEATPRLSAVLQVLQSARQKIRAVTVPPQLQPSATNGTLLDFQETAKSSSLPMPRKSPLGNSSHIDHLPGPSTTESRNPLTGTSVHPLVAVASGGSSEPGLHSYSSHTASKLRQPATTSQSRHLPGKKVSSSGSTHERAEAPAAGDPGLTSGTNTVTSVSALREVVRARREKQAGSSSGRKPSAGDSKKASGSYAAANAGGSAATGAAAGAATSLDVAYYEDKSFQSGSGSERSQSSKSRRAGGGVGSRSSRSGEKQAGKGKVRSNSVALNHHDVSTADEADESIVPLRRSKHSSSHQRSSPGEVKQGRGGESVQSSQSYPLKHAAGSSK
ncbi:unnamed protein product [Closterium sp. Naga37s-1]|nr:unnamed protein product [Closterium sp. Naga37s-1]